MRLVFNSAWATHQLCRAVPTSSSDSAVSIATAADDGALLGGVIFKEYTGESCRLSAVGFEPNWLSRELLWAVFDYAFKQLPLKRVWTGTIEGNAAAVHLNERLGFKYISSLPGIYPGNKSVLIHMLERDECRWLKLRSRTLASNVARAA